MSVKGAEGAAQPFTLEGQAVFCYSPLFRHPVGIVHSQLGVDEVLSIVMRKFVSRAVV